VPIVSEIVARLDAGSGRQLALLVQTANNAPTTDEVMVVLLQAQRAHLAAVKAMASGALQGDPECLDAAIIAADLGMPEMTTVVCGLAANANPNVIEAIVSRSRTRLADIELSLPAEELDETLRKSAHRASEFFQRAVVGGATLAELVNETIYVGAEQLGIVPQQNDEPVAPERIRSMVRRLHRTGLALAIRSREMTRSSWLRPRIDADHLDLLYSGVLARLAGAVALAA
jgi:hypothetical protein